MTAPSRIPAGRARPRAPEDFFPFLERLLNGTLSFGHVTVDGSVSTAIRPVSAATVLVRADRTILADATAGAFAVTLPTAVGHKGTELVVKRMNAGGNNVTVTAAGAETIDGAATAVLAAQYASVRVQSDGANWVVV
jgi:hypothetical protein